MGEAGQGGRGKTIRADSNTLEFIQIVKSELVCVDETVISYRNMLERME